MINRSQFCFIDVLTWIIISAIVVFRSDYFIYDLYFIILLISILIVGRIDYKYFFLVYILFVVLVLLKSNSFFYVILFSILLFPMIYKINLSDRLIHYCKYFSICIFCFHSIYFISIFNSISVYNKIIRLENNGSYTNAIFLYKNIENEFMNNIVFNYNYSRSLYYVGNCEESISIVEKLISNNKNNYEYYILLGLNYSKLGNKHQALLNFRLALDYFNVHDSHYKYITKLINNLNYE